MWENEGREMWEGAVSASKLDRACGEGKPLQGSWGAELDAGLVVPLGAVEVRKGTGSEVDSYSAFADNDGARKTELEGLLRAAGVGRVALAGLAYDVCVAATARDALAAGFKVLLLEDATPAFSADAAAEKKAELRRLGCAFASSDQAPAFLADQTTYPDWLSL